MRADVVDILNAQGKTSSVSNRYAQVNINTVANVEDVMEDQSVEYCEVAVDASMPMTWKGQ